MSKKVRDELLAVQRVSKDKMLHAPHVVAWAKKNKNSALYRQFEWDNTKAAHKYRIWQARQLIQIHVVMEDGSPQFVSLSFDRTKGGGYRGIDDVLSRRDLSDIMLNDALVELQRVQAKYARVRELTSVWTAVKRVRERTSSRRQKQQLAKAA